ncbi:MAG: hypothetical protein IT363_00385 [Methanoregulaceae archaeon]|nr:hypothetical protein [Methanoregulaceae archaeon]
MKRKTISEARWESICRVFEAKQAHRLGILQRLVDRFGADWVCAAVCTQSEKSFDVWLDRAMTLALVSRKKYPMVSKREFATGLATLAAQV